VECQYKKERNPNTAQQDYELAGCDYFDALSIANSSSLVATNYAYWMHRGKYMREHLTRSEGKYGNRFGLGASNVLICDEAHHATTELSNFLKINLYAEFTDKHTNDPIPAHDDPIGAWIKWAEKSRRDVESEIRTLKNRYNKLNIMDVDPKLRRELRKLEELERQLKNITRCDEDWVVEEKNRDGFIALECVNPSKRAEEALFQKVEKVLLVSATINHKTCSLLGLDRQDVDFFEAPSHFDASRRPFIHVDSVRVNYRTGDDDLRIWSARMDQIIERRKDRKGIIHSVSYDRQKDIIDRSRHRDIMISHERGSDHIRAAVEKFKKADAPAVLVSPSMTTGHDFPYDECRYQIISKIPYPDTRSKLMQARTKGLQHWKGDNTYSHHIAMRDLIQMVGRGMRAADDFCEVFIVDNNIIWFIKRYGHYAPIWFISTYKSLVAVPDPEEID